MKNEITIKEVGGRKIIKARVKTPAPKVFRDKKKYFRKDKHKGNSRA